MEKFSKIVEKVENGGYYKVKVTLELSIKADNEGEAGYKSDSILTSIESMSNYQVVNIDKIENNIQESNKK